MEIEDRDLVRHPLNADELYPLIGGRNDLDFLNPENELCRKLRMKEKPPSQAEGLNLMSKEASLIRRPIVIRRGQVLLGYDEQALSRLAK